VSGFALRTGLPRLPDRWRWLPIEERGYPVPYFVAYVDGRPDFRVMDAAKFARCINLNLCWLCGDKLGRYRTFVIGPMCALNRTTAEPPCHTDCAEYAARTCPFLTLPKAARREANLPVGGMKPAGEMLLRNPGVTLLWTCQGYRAISAPAPEGGTGVLFRLLEDPVHVDWYAEGRAATRAEVLESIESGIPILMAAAEREGATSLAALRRSVLRALRHVPAA
jgi:hypothetical protein